MSNISISSPNMKYLSNNNNHFFIKRKLKASICIGKWTKEDDMMYHHIMWGSRLCNKQKQMKLKEERRRSQKQL